MNALITYDIDSSYTVESPCDTDDVVVVNLNAIGYNISADYALIDRITAAGLADGEHASGLIDHIREIWAEQ